MAEYHEPDTHFRVIDCMQCFEAGGRMCHQEDYEHDMLVTRSAVAGWGICCKPDSTDDECNDPLDQKQVCSMKSLDYDEESKYQDVLSKWNINFQMFAFCPMVNHRICGISDDFDNNDMTLYATEEVQTLETDEMVYRPTLNMEMI